MEYVLINNETNAEKKCYRKVAYFQGKIHEGTMIPRKKKKWQMYINISKHSVFFFFFLSDSFITL